MIIEKFFNIGRKKVLNVEEARKLLPLVYKITQESNSKICQLKNQISFIKDFKSRNDLKESSTQILEKMIKEEYKTWQTKIEKLGLKPQGSWFVDFDTGNGYLCWRYPENDIHFFHGYNDGFRGRQKINENCHCTNQSYPGGF